MIARKRQNSSTGSLDGSRHVNFYWKRRIMKEASNLNLRRHDQSKSKRRRSKSGTLWKRATRASLAVCCVLQFALLLSIDFRDMGVNGFVRVTHNRIGIFREAVHRTDEKEDFFSRFRNTDGPVLQHQHQQLHSNTCHNPNSRSRPRSRPILWMGQKGGSKGDKQNRKPKKMAAGSTASTGGSGSSSSSSSSSIPVQRVSNQINVPIRRQIRYGKINKQLREAAATGQSFRQTRKGNFVPAVPGNSGVKKRTSYRKQLDEETIQQKALERQRKGQNPDWSVVLNQTKADPLVLVDGYNVIYKWARLKKHMVRGDTEHARELLLQDLEGLASLRRWRIECVFDGAGRGAVAGPLGSGPGNKNHNALGKNPTTTPFGKAGTVRTVFTGSGIEADTYIEGRCVAAKNVTLGKITSSLIVATDDAQIKLVANSAGALCMGSDRFVLELKAVKKSMQYRVEKAMAEVNGVPVRPEKLWGTSVGGGSGGGSFYEASTVSEPAKAKNTNTTGTATTTSRDAGPSAIEAPTSLRAISAQNRIGTAKKEVVEEHADGSKTIKARYGANEIMITDNRNKKPSVKKYMGGADGEGKKKKKKKKKKK